jgi:lysophospholipid acyltransferase (LPLAT)-like uncharacterized protein
MIARLLGLAWASGLRLLAATWRMTFVGLESAEETLAHEAVLVGFWHGKTLPLYVLFRNRGALIFTSRSFRGSVIAEICRHFGLATQSLPDHGGDEALAMMRNAAAGRRLVGVALDGPLGPFHVVKRGSIQLASEAGLLFLPLALTSSRACISKRRWDRMEIPLPFTSITVAAGAPVAIPPGVRASDVAPWTARILQAMDDAERRASGNADES